MVIEGRVTIGDLVAGAGFLATVWVIWQTRVRDQQEFRNRLIVVESRVGDLWKWFMGDRQTRQRIGRALDERDARNGGTS